MKKIVIFILLAAAAYVLVEQNRRIAVDDQIVVTAGERRVEVAFEQRQSDVQVAGKGVVERVLSDDNEGSRHQRFILELPSGHTVLIVHNIDLAPRIESIRNGDTVAFYGEYAWNPQGGLVHWTHHDPAGRHEGGWLQHEGVVYE